MAKTEYVVPDQTDIRSDDNLHYASFWLRTAATFTDISVTILGSAVSMIFLLSLCRPLMETGTYLATFLFVLLPFHLLLAVFYYVWFNADGRQTLGKKIFGLVVINQRIKPISLTKSIARCACFIFDSVVLLGLGHLAALVYHRHQTIHDRLVNAYVLRIRSPRHNEPLIGVSLIISGLLMLTLAFFLIGSFIGLHDSPSDSMKPTILAGDHLLIDRLGYFSYQPQRGDLVVLKYSPVQTLDQIKRCVATGGQTVEMRQGELLIDNQPEGEFRSIGTRFDRHDMRNVEMTEVSLENGRTYAIQHSVRRPEWRENYGPVDVPEGSIFVMGDNRDNSIDSRHWGFVSVSAIEGKVGLIYYSRSREADDRSIRFDRFGEILN